MSFNSAVPICCFFILFFISCSAQECKFYGQFCSEDTSCCGGCCLNGICRDAYLDCRNVEDPCTDRYCPEDQVCFTYQPPGCKGCGPLTECRWKPLSEELKKNKTLTHYHRLNSSSIVNRLGLVTCLLWSVFVLLF